jgi:multiple sugar transport system ATP-binding protein
MAQVTFSAVGKIYPDGTRAVSDFNLELADGDLTVLVGPSGCGKSTLLRMVAGLEEVSEGELRIGSEVVNTIDARKRDVAMVFQNYALYPHMTVYDNIAFPLRSRRVPKSDVRRQVESVAQLLGLSEMLRRKPRTLSGGQRQRVAMGRALVRQPDVFLMDEPLSNLDANLRVQMRAEISKLQRELGVTTMYVTHDQVEAMTMGTRIAIMRRGELQQLGPPQLVYDQPKNLFVATFIGSPPMNLVQALVEADDDRLTCIIGDQRLPVPPEAGAHVSLLASYAGRNLAFGIRPEHLHAPQDVDASWPRLRGQVQLVEALGFERLAHIELVGEPVLTAEVIEVARDIDAATLQTLEEGSHAHRVNVVARLPAHATVQAGEATEVALDARHIHFFDLDSGNAID